MGDRTKGITPQPLGRRYEGFHQELLISLDRHISGLKSSDPFFIVVGANDGLDPFHHFIQDWRGIQVEPIPQYFRLLQQNCGPRHILEQVALGTEVGSGTIYEVDLARLESLEIEYPKYFRYISSLDRDHLLWHFYEIGMDWEKDFIKESEIELTTLPLLLQKHDVQNIDYLQVDAEGADFEILKSVDYSNPPSIILAEHKHLTESEQDQLLRIFREAGYDVEIHKEDYLAHISSKV